jgi:hypothetical protein
MTHLITFQYWQDPDEWKDFFESISNAHVGIVTVALDNEHLLEILTKRRTLVLNLEMMVRPGYEFDKHNLDDAVENALPLPTMKKLLCSSDAKGIHTKISKLDAKIEEMSKQQYNVSHVFVTFETEEAQRKALKALSVKRLDVWKKSSRSLAKRLLFRGNILLDVAEPVEPSSVRWNDLDELPMVCDGSAVSFLSRNTTRVSHWLSFVIIFMLEYRHERFS